MNFPFNYQVGQKVHLGFSVRALLLSNNACIPLKSLRLHSFNIFYQENKARVSLYQPALLLESRL